MAKGKEISPLAWKRVLIFILFVGGAIWFLNQKAEGRKEILPKDVSEKVKVLGDVFEEKFFRQSKGTIQKTQLFEEINKTINQATEEISGFPEKQKKEIKKQVVEDVCSELLKEVNRD